MLRLSEAPIVVGCETLTVRCCLRLLLTDQQEVVVMVRVFRLTVEKITLSSLYPLVAFNCASSTCIAFSGFRPCQQPSGSCLSFSEFHFCLLPSELRLCLFGKVWVAFLPFNVFYDNFYVHDDIEYPCYSGLQVLDALDGVGLPFCLPLANGDYCQTITFMFYICCCLQLHVKKMNGRAMNPTYVLSCQQML